MTKNENTSKDPYISTEQEWQLSRKAFMRTLVLSGIALQLPWLNSCSGTPEEDNYGEVSPLTLSQFKIVRKIQTILFPQDGNGPGALDIKADRYLIWILNDSLLDPNENTYIIERIKQFEKECIQEMNTSFLDLKEHQQKRFVHRVSTTDWGKNFFSRLLTLIFEALMLDPAYGGNINQIGWDWLEHDPGHPRPNKKIMYPEILKKHEI